MAKITDEKQIDNAINYIMDVCIKQQKFISDAEMYGDGSIFCFDYEEFLNIYNDVKFLIKECKEVGNANYSEFKI